jgi:transcriptional regulator with XRE-family HTH domain
MRKSIRLYTPRVDRVRREVIGARILEARRESGLTQRELADKLGITARSVQNYEAGKIVPWRHLSHIETITRKRPGWLLRDDDGAGALDTTISQLLSAMQQHHDLLREHVEVLRQNTDRLREQRAALQTSRSRNVRLT